jgi:hypothetical protein
MDMLRDISPSGSSATQPRRTSGTGQRIVDALVPRMVQVAREMAGA